MLKTIRDPSTSCKQINECLFHFCYLLFLLTYQHLSYPLSVMELPINSNGNYIYNDLSTIMSLITKEPSPLTTRLSRLVWNNCL